MLICKYHLSTTSKTLMNSCTYMECKKHDGWPLKPVEINYRCTRVPACMHARTHTHMCTHTHTHTLLAAKMYSTCITTQ